VSLSSLVFAFLCFFFFILAIVRIWQVSEAVEKMMSKKDRTDKELYK